MENTLTNKTILNRRDSMAGARNSESSMIIIGPKGSNEALASVQDKERGQKGLVKGNLNTESVTCYDVVMESNFKGQSSLVPSRDPK